MYTEFSELITEEMTGPLTIDIKPDKLKKLKKQVENKTPDKPRKKKKLKVSQFFRGLLLSFTYTHIHMI